MNHQIKTIDYTSPSAKQKLVQSLHDTGFAVLHNHPINKKNIEFVYDEWEKFFNDDKKYDYKFNIDTQDGYFPYLSENAKGYPIKDLKEFFHYYEWGVYPNGISNKTIKLYDELLNIGEEILKWIDNFSPKEISSNFSIPLSNMIHNSKANLLRIIHYPPLNENMEQGAVRAAAHEDINLITILITGSQPGLQVKSNENKWVEVECNPGWLVINIGDMLSECSNGYFPSTSHRVINPVKNKTKSRYTMPLFIHPRDEVILSKKYTAKSFLDERLREIGLKK
tara:strand:+ start:310 stop:1152 length:843 start_codon:yes stop_codon:yes gene_type:complete